jgi:hypothetical protein
VPAGGGLGDPERLPAGARSPVERLLAPDEPIRVVLRGTFASALVATDRRVLIWKAGRLTEFDWANLSEVACGGRGPVRWIQVRGPSIGLAAPGLLNLGVLPDAIQLAEMDDRRARAALEVLARAYAKRRPLPQFDAPITGRAKEANASAPRALLEASGAGARLELLADRVRIHHAGFRGFLRKALPDVEEIALADVAEIEWQPAGPLRLGRIGLRTLGAGNDPVPPEREARGYLHQEGAFLELRAAANRLLSRRRKRP